MEAGLLHTAARGAGHGHGLAARRDAAALLERAEATHRACLLKKE